MADITTKLQDGRTIKITDKGIYEVKNGQLVDPTAPIYGGDFFEGQSNS